MNNITFKQYRNIDLCIFALLLTVSEAVTTVATNSWFAAQPVAISTTLTFICIMMMRWGSFGAIHAVIGGIVFCIASGASAEQFLIYAGGNLLGVLSVLLFKVFTKEAIRKSCAKLILFTSCTYLLIQLGRWIISLFFGGGLWNIVGLLASDIISLLFATVIMLLLRNVDGMIEDQKAYLFRQQREKEEERRQSTGYGSDE